MADQMEQDLLEILDPAIRSDVRIAAVGQLLGMTGSPEGCLFIANRPRLVEAVLSLLFDDNTTIRDSVQKLVVNLTAEERVVQALLAEENSRCLKDTVGNMIQQCLDTKRTNSTLSCGLANLTRVSEAAVFVADTMMKDDSISVSAFVEGLCRLHADGAPTLAIVSTVLMNLTQVPCVRQGLMEPPAHLLLKLLSIMSMSSSLSSCRGVVGAVQNCCFEYDYHEWLLSDQVGLLPRLLLPLAGPEEFDEDDMEKLPLDLQYLPDTKQREADAAVRGMLIKAVNKLCSTKASRLFVKENNTYIIFRELHKWEDCEENIKSILDVIDILIGDEPQSGMEDLHTVEIPPEVEKQFEEADCA